jgi:hypothetical protein
VTKDISRAPLREQLLVCLITFGTEPFRWNTIEPVRQFSIEWFRKNVRDGLLERVSFNNGTRLYRITPKGVAFIQSGEQHAQT